MALLELTYLHFIAVLEKNKTLDEWVYKWAEVGFTECLVARLSVFPSVCHVLPRVLFRLEQVILWDVLKTIMLRCCFMNYFDVSNTIKRIYVLIFILMYCQKYL